ncbi:VWA domain-containing protein [Halorarum salinum]|uniref:VWA domain-containing protein n=1 Tax=Halorarum salinum TaxID=2743089 RepID=A0A7D5Q955_9EURY|nr:VWA domain-containing protein [Halobaculum salinum]
MPRTAAALLVATLLAVPGCVSSSGSGGSVGLSVGGARDANAFRDDVHDGYVPRPTDVTSEGLFHDYYFDTGQSRPCEERFCPSYGRATSTDPLSNETERYLAVGPNSGIPRTDFERKKLNLVVVVDTSGSTSDGIGRYYYDGNGTPSNPETTTKMSAARSALRTLVGHLGPEDRLGIVAYDDDARSSASSGRSASRETTSTKPSRASVQTAEPTSTRACEPPASSSRTTPATRRTRRGSSTSRTRCRTSETPGPGASTTDSPRSPTTSSGRWTRSAPSACAGTSSSCGRSSTTGTRRPGHPPTASSVPDPRRRAPPAGTRVVSRPTAVGSSSGVTAFDAGRHRPDDDASTMAGSPFATIRTGEVRLRDDLARVDVRPTARAALDRPGRSRAS